MYNEGLIIDSLRNIEETLLHVLDRSSWIDSVDDLLTSSSGVDVLDIVTIRLMAVGEEIKKIDKRSNGELLTHYPETQWENIMGFQDVIAHAYFHIDAAVVFDTLRNNVQPLLATIQQILKDLEN
jgi:uncharacterized protein with HEPN domain